MKKFISVFTGEVYELAEEYSKNLDCGQLEITDLPNPSCKKCYGRGYVSKNTTTGHYSICKCLLKNASAEMMSKVSQHQVEDVTLHTKSSDFDSIVDGIYS